MFMGGVETMRQKELRSKSFTVSQPQMTEIERVCLEGIRQIAIEGRQARQAELCAVIGCDYQTGTLPAVINRLVAKGYVERLGGKMQKGLWLRIVATDQQTKEPENKAAHWREAFDKSKDSTPTLPRHTVHQAVPTLMSYLDRMMREENMSLQTAQITLMARGMQQRESERG